jgi:hypothetical protein
MSKEDQFLQMMKGLVMQTIVRRGPNATVRDLLDTVQYLMSYGADQAFWQQFVEKDL